jgi:beclin 1
MNECKRLENTKTINAIRVWFISTIPNDSAGDIGTLNGLRLGRYAGHQTPWSEVNAAWGLCALLLHLLAKEYRVTFASHRIHPLGSLSTIEDVAQEKTYDLCYRKNNGTSFNQGMRRFLLCLKEFGDTMEQRTPSQKKKIKDIDVQKGEIGECSIEYSMMNEIKWIKALKYMVLNLKSWQKL